MKMENFIPAIPEIAKAIGATEADAHRAAVAITTTGRWGGGVGGGGGASASV